MSQICINTGGKQIRITDGKHVTIDGQSVDLKGEDPSLWMQRFFASQSDELGASLASLVPMTNASKPDVKPPSHVQSFDYAMADVDKAMLEVDKAVGGIFGAGAGAAVPKVAEAPRAVKPNKSIINNQGNAIPKGDPTQFLDSSTKFALKYAAENMEYYVIKKALEDGKFDSLNLQQFLFTSKLVPENMHYYLVKIYVERFASTRMREFTTADLTLLILSCQKSMRYYCIGFLIDTCGASIQLSEDHMQLVEANMRSYLAEKMFPVLEERGKIDKANAKKEEDELARAIEASKQETKKRKAPPSKDNSEDVKQKVKSPVAVAAAVASAVGVEIKNHGKVTDVKVAKPGDKNCVVCLTNVPNVTNTGCSCAAFLCYKCIPPTDKITLLCMICRTPVEAWHVTAFP